MAPVTWHPIFSVLAFIRQAFFHPRLRVELVLIERERAVTGKRSNYSKQIMFSFTAPRSRKRRSGHFKLTW